MVINPMWTSSSPSTTASVTVSASPSISVLETYWGWNWDITSIIDEDDFEYQLKQRRLRYSPFHVKNHPLVKSIYFNRKPIPIRQTILQPFRITRLS